MPLGSDDVETPLLLTGSISSSEDTAHSDIDGQDRRLIASALEQALVNANLQIEDRRSLAWTNLESGNSGTIGNVDQTIMDATGCLSFETTANTIAGVQIYSGTACRDISQKLAVTALSVGKA